MPRGARLCTNITSLKVSPVLGCYLNLEIQCLDTKIPLTSVLGCTVSVLYKFCQWTKEIFFLSSFFQKRLVLISMLLLMSTENLLRIPVEYKVEKCWTLPESHAKGFFILFLTVPIICLLPALEYHVISCVRLFIIFIHNYQRVRRMIFTISEQWQQQKHPKNLFSSKQFSNSRKTEE